MTARKGGVGRGISLYAPRRSSQHLVGDTFQLDGEQLNPSTAGQRKEERREEAGGKKEDEKKRSSNQSTRPGFR